ncbi:MAG: hypothetical protein H6907_07230 [Hyphomicrobiales bacterium]|nr:hypothetical protein [Hyphomicrobiales bacterium]
MSSVRLGFPFHFLVGMAALAGAVQAQAAVKSPACPQMVALGQTVVPGQYVGINPAPGRVKIPTAFDTPGFVQAYGKPAIEWDQNDVAAAMKEAATCGQTLKKARDVAGIKAVTVLYQGFGALRSAVGTMAASEPKLDSMLKTLLADPATPGALDALGVVLSVRDGGAEAWKNSSTALRNSAMRLRITDPANSHAQYLLTTMADVPAKSWDRVFPPVEERRTQVHDQVVADTKAQIDAVPANEGGLRGMDRTMKIIESQIGPSLTQADMKVLADAATARRGAIEDAMLADETARVAAVPADANGLQQLRVIQAGPLRKILSPERMAVLDTRVAERRTAIGSVVTDAQIKRLDQFPETMAGLRDLDVFKNQTAGGLAALVGPSASGRFRDAAEKRASVIGEKAFPPFQKALAAMPETDEGLAELERALAEIKGPIAGMAPPIRARYTEAAVKRHDQIAAAVQKADARLAKLPLAGGVFVDRRLNAKMEFRNKERVYVTFVGETTEAGYEQDGDRLIVRLPQANMVFKRDGAWIRGNDLNLKRQAAK